MYRLPLGSTSTAKIDKEEKEGGPAFGRASSLQGVPNASSTSTNMAALQQVNFDLNQQFAAGAGAGGPDGGFGFGYSPSPKKGGNKGNKGSSAEASPSSSANGSVFAATR